MNDDLAALGARLERTNELLQRMLAEVAKTPSTHAIFVDAGYVYAAAGSLVAGTEDRRSFDLDAEGLIEAFIDKARTIFADSRLLRVYWYDGARRRIHTAEQQSIAELPDVKVRLGNLNANNQQKGVDSLIRTDLESLARHRAISDAALVGGDEDLVSAVEAAQGYGARVHLWGIEAAEGRNQAEPLLWEVDSQRTFDLDFCKPYITRAPGHDVRERRARRRPPRDDVRFVGAQIAATWLAARGRDAAGGAAARPPVPARLRRPGPADRGGGAAAVLAAGAGRPAAGAAGRLLGAPAGAVLSPGGVTGTRQPGRPRSRRARAAVSAGRSVLGECSAPAIDGPAGAQPLRHVVEQRHRPGVVALAGQHMLGQRRTAASSATRSGSTSSWRPVAISWAGLWRSQRRRRSSPIPRAGAVRRPPAGRVACIASQTSSMLITRERVAAAASRAAAGRRRSAAGPEDMRVSERKGAGSSSTAARAIWPPRECPSEMHGAVPSASAWASTSCANSAWAYAASSSRARRSRTARARRRRPPGTRRRRAARAAR